MEAIYTCEIIVPVQGVKRSGSGVVRKSYQMGQRVKGKRVNQAVSPMSQAMAFQTTDGYIIPLTNLRVISVQEPVQTAREVKDTDFVSKEQSEEMGKYKSKLARSALKDMKKKAGMTTNALIVGGVLGFAFAVYKGRNKLMFSALGATAGLILSRTYNNLIGDKNVK